MTELKLLQCRLDSRYDIEDCLGRGSYAEIYLDRRGEGQGTFIPAAKVRLEGDNWVVEDFGEFPARLLGLRARGGVGVAR